MGTNASKRDSIKRATSLLKYPESEDGYVILKLLPDPRGCCCFHCWPSTWTEINRYISPQGPIPDEGDALIRTKDGDYVLECHESGPEIVIYLGVATASLVLAKSVIDLLTTFLKALQKERAKPPLSVKLSRRRVIKGRTEDEILMEISFPLADDTVGQLNKKMQETLQEAAKQDLPDDTENNTTES